MDARIKLYVSLWWLIQLCGLIVLGIRHLGHLFVVLLLLASLVGYVFGGRKVALVSSLGLASYAALTFIGALLYQMGSVYGEWLLPAATLVIAVLNLVISFWTIKKLNNNLSSKSETEKDFSIYYE